MTVRSPLLPIFLIVLVDVLGFTIVIPLLALYAERFGATPLVATTLVSVYALCSLVSTPIIGRLSDRWGRRPLLLVSQAGTCAGFLVLGNATALWMVFLGRILDGITAGNLATAQAYISDHSKPEDRARSFSVIGIAFGIGFMVGPGLGGWLGHAFGMHVPFYVAAALSALSMVCTATLLPRAAPRPVTGPSAPGVFDLRTYAEFFRRPGLASLYLQFFLFTFAFSAFTSGFALFAEARFHWTARETGWLFTYAGLLGVVLQARLLGPLVTKLGEVRLAIAGFVAVSAAYTLLGFAGTTALLVVCSTLTSFGNGVLRPVLTSRISRRVGPGEQGTAIGISGSLSSLAMTLAPPSGGAMLDHHWTLGWALTSAIVASVGLVAALIGRSEGSTRSAAA
jgi:MFS family permease